MKYIEKSWDLDEDEPQNLYHVAALWALNGRSFSVSRGLLEVKRRVRMGFVYLGSFSRNIVEGLFDRGIEWGLSFISYSRLMGVLSVV
jgi:hypothetical protein